MFWYLVGWCWLQRRQPQGTKEAGERTKNPRKEKREGGKEKSCQSQEGQRGAESCETLNVSACFFRADKEISVRVVGRAFYVARTRNTHAQHARAQLPRTLHTAHRISHTAHAHAHTHTRHMSLVIRFAVTKRLQCTRVGLLLWMTGHGEKVWLTILLRCSNKCCSVPTVCGCSVTKVDRSPPSTSCSVTRRQASCWCGQSDPGAILQVQQSVSGWLWQEVYRVPGVLCACLAKQSRRRLFQ